MLFINDWATSSEFPLLFNSIASSSSAIPKYKWVSVSVMQKESSLQVNGETWQQVFEDYNESFGILKAQVSNFHVFCLGNAANYNKKILMYLSDVYTLFNCSINRSNWDSSHFFSFSLRTLHNWSIDKFVVQRMSIEGGCNVSGTIIFYK